MFSDKKSSEGEDGDVSKTARRRQLNPELQKLVDNEEEFLDQIYDGHSADSVDTSFRYSAYAARIRTLMISAHRYVAYTSEVGESFRPVAHPWLVRGAYGISWAYIFGDVANEGYKAYLRNRQVLAPQCEAYKNATSFVPVEATLDQVSPKGLEEHEPHERHLQDQSFNSTSSSRHPIPWRDPEEDTLTPWSTMKVPLHEDYRAVMAERAVFQVLASMALPAFTIHSVVKHSGRAMKGFKSTLLRTWGPVGLGLCIVPVLPYLFDQPVEHAVQWSFRRAFLAIAGPDAVPPPPSGDTAASRTLTALQDSRQHRREERERRREERRLRRKKEE